MNVIAYEGEEK